MVRPGAHGGPAGQRPHRRPHRRPLGGHDDSLALLTEDAILTMPPIDVRIEGAESVGEFFATEPLGGHIERIRLIPTTASGQPGFACYADEHDTGEHAAYGIMIFALRGDGIAGITGFPQDADLFERLGAPLELTAS